MASAMCVFCRRQLPDPRWRPFCSQRCQIQDLARWADGSYAIPTEEAPQDADESRATFDDRTTDD